MFLFSIKEVTEYIENIKEFLVDSFNFIDSIFRLLPSPFSSMALGFLGIVVAIIVIKIVRG